MNKPDNSIKFLVYYKTLTHFDEICYGELSLEINMIEFFFKTENFIKFINEQRSCSVKYSS